MTTRVWQRLVTLLVCLLIVGIVYADGEAIAFTFAPPVGTQYTERVDLTTTTAAQGTVQTRKATATSTVSIAQDPKGLCYTSTITNMQITLDGRMASDLFTNLLQGVTFLDFISPRGEFIDIGGDEVFRDKIMANAPPVAVDAMLRAASHEAFLKDEQMSWSRRVARFLGRTVNVGDRWYDTIEIVLPNKVPITIARSTQVAGWMQVKTQKLLHIVSLAHSSRAELATAIDVPYDDIVRQLADVKDVAGVTVTVADELLLDPATMLYYGERMRTDIYQLMPAQRSGKRQLTSSDEKAYYLEYK